MYGDANTLESEIFVLSKSQKFKPCKLYNYTCIFTVREFFKLYFNVKKIQPKAIYFC